MKVVKFLVYSSICFGTTAFSAYFIYKIFEKRNEREEECNDEWILNPRIHDDLENSETNASTSIGGEERMEGIEENYEIYSLPQLVCEAQSINHEVQLAALKQICKLLSSDNGFSVDALIKDGVFPVLVESLKSNHAKIQHKAAWALKTIASGTIAHTQAVVDAGGVPALIDLLASPHLDVCEQVVYALGNIICAGPKFRDFCIQNECLQPLIKLINSDIDVHLLFSITLILPNLFPNPTLPCEVVYALLPALAEQIASHDPTALIDTAKIVSHLVAKKDDEIDTINFENVIKSIRLLFNHPDSQVQYSALHCLAVILTKIPSQNIAFFDENLMSQLAEFLNSPNLIICKAALKVVGVISSLNPEYVKAETKILEILQNFKIHHDKEVEDLASAILNKF